MLNQIKIDATTLPALIFGAVLILISIVMAVFSWRAYQSLKPLVADDEVARQHAKKQLRRRWQVSLILAIIGIVIAVGDQLDQLFIQRPLLFFGWIAIIFVLVVWLILMALGDWVSTLTYSELAKAKLRGQRRELEEEIRRYHATRNGESHSNPESD
jgi:hypothetical protein